MTWKISTVAGRKVTRAESELGSCVKFDRQTAGEGENYRLA